MAVTGGITVLIVCDCSCDVVLVDGKKREAWKTYGCECWKGEGDANGRPILPRLSCTANSNVPPRCLCSQQHILGFKGCNKMPNTFSKWIDKKLSLPLPKWDQEPPLPTLPQTRPRVLTPSPSRETLTLSAASATTNSAFFQTLPFEIRHKILKEAFGNYTVHMHLSYDFPKPPLSIRQQDPKHRHANVRKVPPLPPPQSKFSIPKRMTWQWWSCICHRASPWTLSQSRPPTTQLDKPCYDGCYTTIGSSWCEFWPGGEPGKCFIGVMGWLLSCRQALVPLFQSFELTTSYAGWRLSFSANATTY